MNKIYITIDTECHDPSLLNQYIFGRTKSGERGLKLILELGKKMGVTLNFFFDVAEIKRYGDEYGKNIINLIRSYNQPIFFHFHPNYISGNDEKTYLWQYTDEEQLSLLKEGMDYYSKYCGNNRILVFRAGRYGVNESTYSALRKIHDGPIYDLSYFYGNMKMCHLDPNEVGAKNNAKVYRDILLIPNTTYVGFDYFGKKSTFLLNCANTTGNEFKRIIDLSKNADLIYTMHSWDLMKKWFFDKKHVYPDKYVEDRFIKNIKYAYSKGYTFGNLLDYKNDYPGEDNILNLCHSFTGKIQGLMNNFIRFWIIGRINKKYFFFYVLSFSIAIVLFALIFIILFFVI